MNQFRNTMGDLKELLQSIPLDDSILDDLEELKGMITLKINDLRHLHDEPEDDIDVPTMVDDLAEDMHPESAMEDDYLAPPFFEDPVAAEHTQSPPATQVFVSFDESAMEEEYLAPPFFEDPVAAELTQPPPTPQVFVSFDSSQEENQGMEALHVGDHHVTEEDISPQVSEIPPEIAPQTMETTFSRSRGCNSVDIPTVSVKTSPHTNGKPRQMFVCGECDYESSSKHKMKDHLNTHSGEKPFKCTKCTYSAAGRGSLFNHMKTHEEQKIYKCAYCTQHSNRLDNMKRHIGRKHKNLTVVAVDSGAGVPVDDEGTQTVHK